MLGEAFVSFMVRILDFHCKAPGSVPRKGTEILQAMWDGQEKKLDETSPSTHSQGDNSFNEKSHQCLNPSRLAHRRPEVHVESDEAFFSVTHEGHSPLTSSSHPSALSSFLSLPSKLPGLSELHD